MTAAGCENDEDATLAQVRDGPAVRGTDDAVRTHQRIVNVHRRELPAQGGDGRIFEKI